MFLKFKQQKIGSLYNDMMNNGSDGGTKEGNFSLINKKTKKLKTKLNYLDFEYYSIKHAILRVQSQHQ